MKLQPRKATGWVNVWIQLVGGIILAAVLPYGVRLALGADQTDLPIINSTIVGVAAATIMAIWLTRHISAYPGEEAVASILPSFGISYGALLVVFVLTHFHYNRFNLLFGFVAGMAWMFYVLMMTQRQRPTIGVLPFGNIEAMVQVSRVRWVRLTTPDDPVYGLDAIAADLRSDLPDEWETRLADYALSRVPVFHSKHLMESLTGRVELEHLSENSFGSLAPRPAYKTIKHIVDWIAAAALLIILLPAMIVLGILIRLNSRGPALFVQERIGYLGKPFRVYKFRTMYASDDRADDMRRAAITQDADLRVTSLGKILRKTRLDETPQLINILRGEMSFIGPRPEAAILSRWYEEEIPFYRYRHIVRPGIGGWAQVCQGHVADVDAVRSKLHYDFYYIKHYSPWIDLLITIRTAKTMITGFGAK